MPGFVLAFSSILTFLIGLKAPEPGIVSSSSSGSKDPYPQRGVNLTAHACCCCWGCWWGWKLQGAPALAKRPSISEAQKPIGDCFSFSPMKWEPFCQRLLRNEISRRNKGRICLLLCSPISTFQTCMINPFFFPGEGRCRRRCRC